MVKLILSLIILFAGCLGIANILPIGTAQAWSLWIVGMLLTALWR